MTALASCKQYNYDQKDMLFIERWLKPMLLLKGKLNGSFTVIFGMNHLLKNGWVSNAQHDGPRVQNI